MELIRAAPIPGARGARGAWLLRRTGPNGDRGSDGGVHAFGDVVVDTSARSVTRAGQEVAVTPKEFDLLVALIRREGAVASRVTLMKEVWGHRAAIASRTVDTHIAELRRKLEDEPSDPRWILTVHKAGYRFRA